MKKIRKYFRVIAVAIVIVVLFSVPVHAAGKDLFEVADDIIRDVYTHIAGISTVLAGLMTAVAVVTMKFSSTQQKSDQAFDWLKRIWIAWAIINGIGAFLAYITPLFDGYATLPGGTTGGSGGTGPTFTPDAGGGSSPSGGGGAMAAMVNIVSRFI